MKSITLEALNGMKWLGIWIDGYTFFQIWRNFKFFGALQSYIFFFAFSIYRSMGVCFERALFCAFSAHVLIVFLIMLTALVSKENWVITDFSTFFGYILSFALLSIKDYHYCIWRSSVGIEVISQLIFEGWKKIAQRFFLDLAKLGVYSINLNWFCLRNCISLISFLQANVLRAQFEGVLNHREVMELRVVLITGVEIFAFLVFLCQLYD